MSVVTRIRTSQELTVPFTPEEVWGVLADVAAYPDWWPAKLGVEILHHTGELLGTEFEVRPLLGRLFRVRFEEVDDTRSMRLRFFGGSLEGPGGFHLHAVEGATRVRYEMDVFARGLDVAVLSAVLPLESIHRSRMRSVLNSMASRLKSLRKAADRKVAVEARSLERDLALRRQAGEEAARRLAAEEVKRQAEKDAAARAAAEAAERRVAEEEAARVAAQEAARQAAEAEAARLAAEEESRKRAVEAAAAHAAAEEAERSAAAQEATRQAAEAEARKWAEEEEAARVAAQEAARQAAEAEAARLAAEEQSRKRAAEAAAAHAAAEEAERGAAAQEATRQAGEAEARKRAEEENAARAAAEAAERRAAEEAAARVAAQEAERQAAEAEAARLAAQEAARKRAEEEAAARAAAEEEERRAAAEGAARQAAEAEARKRAEEEDAARAAAEAERRAAEEDAARVAAQEAERQATEAEAARLAAEGEAQARAEEEAVRRTATQAAAKWTAVDHATPGVSGDVDHAVSAGEGSIGSRVRPFWGRIVSWLREAPAAPAPPLLATDRADQESANPPVSNFDIARRYLDALSSDATPEEIGRHFAAEVTDEEFAHRFLGTAVTRGFDGILEARERALARFGSQRYELVGATGGGSQVAMEVRWRGWVAATGEGYTAGQELDARIAVFLKFAGGKIVRQRTHACFEPWSTKAERMLTLDERVTQAGQSTKAPPHGPTDTPIQPKGSNFAIARNYLDALSARADADAIARYYAVDAAQDEFPNRFLPGGAHRDLQAIKLARSRGLALMAAETYELVGATGGGSQVALEVAWSGVVSDGMGRFASGQKLETRLGIFLRFRDGLIVAQRNYDCA